MPRRIRLLLLFAVTLASISGCSKRSRFEVQSDTCWDGYVDRQARIAECGDKSYQVTGSFDCVTVQKQTLNGYLRIRIEGGAWLETTEPLGLITICR